MRIHFIGIGGIGVSALAQYYLAKGHQVSGSDLNRSEITDLLKEKGTEIFIGKHKSDNLPKDTDLVIFSPAVKKDNSEYKKVLELKIKCQSYPQALGKLTKKYFTIAVSGTHGKSTTSSMLALILIKAQLDPTVIIGTKLKEFGNSNFRAGKSAPRQNPEEAQTPYGVSKFGAGQEYLLIEADEWQASFLNYWPKIIILTNIEKEHLDYYKNLNHILRTYKEYVSHLPRNGMLVMNRDDKNISKLKTQNLKPYLKIQNFSLKQKETKKLKQILKVPGEHNIENALAALETARALKIPDEVSFQALSEYQSAWRRFEISKGSFKNYKLQTINYKLISDYAHHPTEVLATLKATREKFKNKKIWLVFQPHQYQRTFYLFTEFINVFQKAQSKLLANKIIITDIFDVSGREDEKLKKKVSSKKLVEKLESSSIIYLEKNKIISYLKDKLKDEDVIIIMGAGDIYKLGDELSTA